VTPAVAAAEIQSADRTECRVQIDDRLTFWAAPSRDRRHVPTRLHRRRYGRRERRLVASGGHGETLDCQRVRGDHPRRMIPLTRDAVTVYSGTTTQRKPMWEVEVSIASA
jgi:hypothetical protein